MFYSGVLSSLCIILCYIHTFTVNTILALASYTTVDISSYSHTSHMLDGCALLQAAVATTEY